jgi:hypothetical protein
MIAIRPSRGKARRAIQIRHPRDGHHIRGMGLTLPIINRCDLNLPPQRRDQTVTAAA